MEPVAHKTSDFLCVNPPCHVSIQCFSPMFLDILMLQNYALPTLCSTQNQNHFSIDIRAASAASINFILCMSELFLNSFRSPLLLQIKDTLTLSNITACTLTTILFASVSEPCSSSSVVTFPLTYF